MAWGLLLSALASAGAVGWHWLGRPTEAELLRQAVRLSVRGDREAARVLFDRVLKRNPSERTALFFRGQLAFEAGDLTAAVGFLSRVPDDPPQDGGTARFLQGALLLQAGRAREAETAFLKSIDLKPDSLEPHEELLKLYVLQLRPHEILRELDALRRFRPWTLDELYQIVYVAGIPVNRDETIPLIQKFIAADPADLDSHVALARYEMRDERYGEAAQLLERVLRMRPDDVRVRAYLAEALLGRGDLNGARDALARAPASRTSPPCLCKSLGLYSFASSDWKRAAVHLRRAVALDPDDLAANYKLALALERGGETDAAAPYFERVELLEELRTKMVRFSSRHRSGSGTPFSLILEIGTLLMKLNRYSEAVAYFEQALTWNPDSAAARESHARAVQGRESASAREVARALQDGSDSEAAYELAANAGGLAARIHAARTGNRPAPGILLVDCHGEVGLLYQYFNGQSGQGYLTETTGGGVAVLDFDGDGWSDLYFPQGCRIPSDPADFTHTDRLFRNLGKGAFAEVTANAAIAENQYGQGCAAGDFNNDGFPDLAVANYGTNVLYRNNGDGTFTDVTSASGVGGRHYSTSLAWGDLDRDGNLDMYVANYVRDPVRVCRKESGALTTCHPHTFEAEQDVLYMSRGDGIFDDATHASGMLAPDGRGLGVIVADLDDDGWPDVYVANDGTPNFLFQNLGVQAGNGLKFAERGLTSGSSLRGDGNSQASMGIACADLDGDGRLDLYVTNFYREADTLYLNRGDLLFEDASVCARLAEPTRSMLGWGTQAIDVDLDGRLELFLTNGHLEDRRDEGIPWKMPSQLLYNLGEGRFADISRTSGEFFAGEHLGHGVARLDWDRDGRPDLVVVYHDRPTALLHNETEPVGHRLVLELHGSESNRDAIGARIAVSYAGSRQILGVCGGDGYCATNERRQIVGIGPATEVAELEVRWPGGRMDRWTAIPADTRLILIEGRQPYFAPIQDK
ncbi:MAG: FG-GAP-like repeat-containing protein [Deltaproteobacteria bacterium]